MPIPTRARIVDTRIKDVGLTASIIVDKGWPVRLVDENGTIYFVFSVDPEKLNEVQEQYWNGTLKLPARDLLLQHRLLKDRLYGMKPTRRMTGQL